MSQHYYYRKVCCRIMNVPHLHEEITSRLRVLPNEQHKRGDPRRNSKQAWPNDIWILESPLRSTSSFDRHLEWLSKHLLPHYDFLHGLRKRGAGIDIFLSYTGPNGSGFDLSPQSIRILSELGIPLAVSVCTE